MSFFLANLTVLISFLFIFSSRVEQNRIVTIQKPLVITQERKSPAYYLYQKTVEHKNIKNTQPLMTTYLSTQNLQKPTGAIGVAEMKVDHRLIASEADSGFSYQEKAAPPPSTTLDTAYRVSETVKPPTNQSSIKKWATIKGKFELKDGVGIVDHIVELKRIEEGQLREVGRVDLKEGVYWIDIEAPQGKLIAQIRDRSGILIGEDEQKLINLQSRGSYFEGPFIRVGHTGSGAIAANPPNNSGKNPNSLDGFGKGRSVTRGREKPNVAVSLFSNQHQLDQPNEAFKNISKWSSTVALINDLNGVNYPVVSIRQTNDPYETPFFTKKWLEGALEYISDQQKIEFKSKTAPVLIGQVYLNEKLAAGVQVQIENHPGVFPIYFDQFMIPNFRLTETSESGYFMFVGLEEDAYSVVAFKENKIIGHQIFAAQEGVISFQNIVSSTTPSQQIVRVFDAFTSEPIETELIISDLEEILPTIDGSATYKTHSKMGITEVIARTNAANYIPIRMIQDARKEYAHIPMIQQAWLTQIQSTKMINDQPNTGAIIGFVTELDYEVFLADENYTKDLVVYFDRFGQVVPAPVVGGGFILFNVPTGAAEVVVQQKETDKIYSQVFNVRNNEVSVSQFAD